MSSMRGARNNTLAGVFVIAAIVLALVVVILLGGALERIGTRDYSVRFSLAQGVMGIVPGAKVSVGGRDAGSVKRLRFERQRADVQREIDRLQSIGDSGPALMELLQRKQTLGRRLNDDDL